MATVVVMEDDTTVRGLIVRVLEMEGYRVRAFEDAGPALEMVDFSRVDLVITDLQMPTSGEEAIRAIREQGIEIPILVMSGNVDGEREKELRRLGAQEVVRKPFMLLDLLDVVQRLI